MYIFSFKVSVSPEKQRNRCHSTAQRTAERTRGVDCGLARFDALHQTGIISHDDDFYLAGFDALDVLLDGGVYGGEMVEIEGEVATGKTQLCLAAATRAAQQNHRVLYIDTSGSFSPSRILMLAGINPYDEYEDTDVEVRAAHTMKYELPLGESALIFARCSFVRARLFKRPLSLFCS